MQERWDKFWSELGDGLMVLLMVAASGVGAAFAAAFFYVPVIIAGELLASDGGTPDWTFWVILASTGILWCNFMGQAFRSFRVPSLQAKERMRAEP